MRARIVFFWGAICANIFAQVCSEPVKSFNRQIKGDVVEKGDFNNDGKIDLAIGNSTKNGNFFYDFNFLTGNTSCEFDTVYRVKALDKPTKILFGDFNNDGKDDVAFIKDTLTTQNQLWEVTGTIDRKMVMEQSFQISNGNI